MSEKRVLYEVASQEKITEKDLKMKVDSLEKENKELRARLEDIFKSIDKMLEVL